ncbi:flagellar hook-length control protein FliK [Enterobacter sp. UNJFSC 003]|uniref:flagellar hook-length control protein FliK n=1 Tax=Enterobacter sp. UNJFSC 003 TaxID=3122077 RepID=UPI002ECBC82E|nr:flagellar hook-length control protein FliK [Serratia liquefaciens]
MNLMLSQLTQLPVAAEQTETSAPLPAANSPDETPAEIDVSAQTPPAFNDALLNIINSLMGGEQQRDTAMVLADVQATDDDAREENQTHVSPRVEDLIGSPQQLLDALLMASQMPVKTLNATTTRMPLTGDALKMQNMTLGQPAKAPVLIGQPQPTLAAVTPEPAAADAVKPAATDTAKPLMTLVPTPGQPAVTQTFTSMMDKQTVNLPPVKMDADEAKWAQQLHSALNDRLQLQVRNQVQHATIRLDPPEMGKVDISLQIENGRMQVHISASNGETYRALQQISAELRQSLTEQNTVQVNVHVSSQSGQSHQGRGQQHTSAPQESPVAGAVIVEDDARAAVNKDDSVLLTV